jgi:quercetin dioxygenase-like cupin family protein
MKVTVATLILLVLGLAATLCAEQVPPVMVTRLSSTRTTASGQPIDVPSNPQVVVSRYEIAPNAALSMHKHPYPRYAYVLVGTLEVTVDAGKTYRYKAGDFFTEVIGQCHFGRNVGDSPVQLLVIDQVTPGQSNIVPCPEETAGAKSSH